MQKIIKEEIYGENMSVDRTVDSTRDVARVFIAEGFLESRGRAVYAQAPQTVLNEARLQKGTDMALFHWLVSITGLRGVNVDLATVRLVTVPRGGLTNEQLDSRDKYATLGARFVQLLSAMQSYTLREDAKEAVKRCDALTSCETLAAALAATGFWSFYYQAGEEDSVKKMSKTYVAILGFLALHFPMQFALQFCINSGLSVGDASSLLRMKRYSVIGNRVLLSDDVGGRVGVLGMGQHAEMWRGASVSAKRMMYIHKHAKFTKPVTYYDMDLLFIPMPKLQELAVRHKAYALIGQRYMTYVATLHALALGRDAAGTKLHVENNTSNNACADLLKVTGGVELVYPSNCSDVNALANVIQGIIGWLYIEQGHFFASKFMTSMNLLDEVIEEKAGRIKDIVSYCGMDGTDTLSSYHILGAAIDRGAL